MRIDLKFVELHTPLFLAGTNFGMKLYTDPKKNSKGSLEIWYETDIEHTFVIYNGEIAIIEATASKTIADPEQVKMFLKDRVAPSKGLFNKTNHAEASIKSIVNAQVSGPGMGLMSAQVSDPTSKAPKKPGKPAKYQGEESQGE